MRSLITREPSPPTTRFMISRKRILRTSRVCGASKRRIKAPHLDDPEYARAARHPRIVEVLQDLWGTVRFDTGKLNMKSAEYGAPVEWHQDLGLLSAHQSRGCRGSHQGPVTDHHGLYGRFCGAIDRMRCDLDF